MFIPFKLYVTFPTGGEMKFAIDKCCKRENGAGINNCESKNGVSMELSK